MTTTAIQKNTTSQNLPTGWQEVSLGEVVETNIETVKNDYIFKDILYLDTGSITKGRIEELKKIKLSEAPSRAKRLVKKFDIVYSTVRPNQEHYGFLESPEENLVASTGFTVISANQEKSYPKFLYYFLTQKSITDKMQQIAEHSVSTYPSIKPESLENLKFNLPPLPQQKAIAGMLGAFDDKIELLREQNETLEQIGETVFKEWFLPVRGTQTGGKYKVGDDLPDGWRIGKLGEIISIKGGGTPSTKNRDFWDGDIHWTSPKDLSGAKSIFLFDTAKKITSLGLEKVSSGLLPVGTLLLSSRAPVGYLSISTIKVAINQGYIAILPDGTLSILYMFLWLKVNMDTIKNAASGSTFIEISKKVFKELDIAIPEQKILESFDNKIKPLFEKIKNNSEQIQTLSKTRDTLLPRLMKGEIILSEK